MLFNKSIFTIFILSIIISCKDHDVVSEKPCQFLGIKSQTIQKSYALVSTYNYDSELSNNDKRLPVQYKSTIKRSTIDTTDQYPITSTSEEHLYKYEYDNYGYLSRLTHTTLTLNQGSDKATFIYDNYPPYRQGQIEVSEVTDYEYEAGLLHTLSTKTAIIFSSEKTTPKTQSNQINKSYRYDLDAKGSVLKMTEISAGGGTQISDYINGTLSSKIYLDQNGGTYVTTIYNQTGKIVSSKSGSTETKYNYDNKGNLTKLETFYNNNLNIVYEYSYDNNPNPELITGLTIFKGILDPFQILITADGVNNIISSKITNFQTSMIYENKIDYKFNSKGYPKTSSSISDTNGSTLTAYKYQDCN